MKPRAFNKVEIVGSHNCIIKSSTNKKKLSEEVNYYLKVPDSLKKFFPQFIKYDPKNFSYQLEFIKYPTLSEVFLNQNVSYDEGKFIIDGLLEILDKIHAIKAPNNFHYSLGKFCVEKIFQRINKLNLSFFDKFYNIDSFKINNRKFYNLKVLKNELTEKLLNNTHNNAPLTMMHGDFCFSNILYSKSKFNFKLIDPRGSFVKPGIYGHFLYDYAKILHCLHGEYDYILTERYILQEKTHFQFDFNIQSPSILKKLRAYFIQKLLLRNVDIEFLYLVEASLFLSMTSLHYENPQRQKAFFLKGLIILNNVLKPKRNFYRREENNYAFMY